MHSRFFTEDQSYWVETSDPAGLSARYPVRYTFGVAPLQQLLLEVPGGALHAFTVAWDVQEKRWFDLQEQQVEPGSALHWTGRQYAWASACASCHSTGFEARFDLKTGQATPRWEALTVACNACHLKDIGPSHGSKEQGGLAHAPQTNPAPQPLSRAEAHAQVAGCAPCHTRRFSLQEGALRADTQGGGIARATPNEPDTRSVWNGFLDHMVPELLHAGLYHVDGQIEGEVFEVGSFTQSRMFDVGVACSDCHDPHRLALKAQGNALCTRCHTEQLSPDLAARFPSLAKRSYDTSAHSHHAQGSKGAQCVSCHMPETVYMKIDGRRDHSIRVPRPDLTEALGVPNACSSCHSNQTPAWASQAISSWFGEGWKRPSTAHAIAAGRAQSRDAAELLKPVIEATAVPELVRATALELMARLEPPPAGATDLLQGALSGPSPLLRVVAARAAGNRLVAQLVPSLVTGLRDPVRAVRVESANALAGRVPEAELPAEDFSRALHEYVQAQQLYPDQAEGHANLGTLYLRQGKAQDAERALQAALAVDPAFFPAANNLGMLYYQQGRLDAAEVHFRKAALAAPEQGTLHYSLGLLLEERGKTQEARASLETAAQLLPNVGGVQRNYALLLAKLGHREEAVRVLERAAALLPEENDIRTALRAVSAPTVSAPTVSAPTVSAPAQNGGSR